MWIRREIVGRARMLHLARAHGARPITGERTSWRIGLARLCTSSMTTTRREFLVGMGAGAAAGLLRPLQAAEVPQGPLPGAPKAGDIQLPAGARMPMRPLGRTGVQVSLVGLGGYHLGTPPEAE